MHYYQFNIADYRKDTTHLTPIEHFIYRSLIDWYYLDEKPIPKRTQSVMRRLGLGSELVDSLKNVLEDFFVLEEEGYTHVRIEQELAKYQARADIARVNGSKGGRPKKPNRKPKKTKSVNLANPEETGSKANQEPITNNHNTTPKQKVERPADVEAQVWDDFLSHRKRVRADVTITAVNRIRGQADKAGMSMNDVLSEIVARGWRGFRADWLKEDNKNNDQTEWAI